MSTELRRVPKDWQHPSDHRDADRYESKLAYVPPPFYRWRPLLDKDWATAEREWWRDRIAHAVKRALYYLPSLFGWLEPPSEVCWPWTLEDHPRPRYLDYRPRWQKRERTHYQLYEDVSEGTPISPVCATVDELVEWCAAQTKEVWVGTQGMTRAEWQRFFERGGYSMSGVFTPETGFVTGIKYMAREGDI